MSKYNLAKIKLFLTTILVFIQSCFHGKPNWIESRPQNVQYYHGIGFASLLESDNPKELARQYAINEIASQIKINISSNMEVIVFDFNGSVENTVNSVTKSRFNLLIPELEFIDYFELHNGIYYYVRLNKERYKISVQRLRLNAVETAMNFIDKADKVLSAESFELIQKAWIEILPFNDEPISVTFNGEEWYLYALIKDRIYSYLNRLNVKIELDKQVLKTFIDKRNYLTINVYDNMKKGIAGIPIKLNLPNETLTLYTNNNGALNHSMIVNSQTGVFEVLYGVDVVILLKDFKLGDNALDIRSKIGSESFEVVPSKATIVSNEINHGMILEKPILEPFVEEYFSGVLEFGDNPPEIKILIDSNTIKKSKRMGNNFPYFSFGNTNLKFVNTKNNVQIFSTQILDIKGADFHSQEVAGLRAYENMLIELGERLVKIDN